MSNKISVVIPSYNHREYIEEAINSVLGQSYPPIEIIVVDDGSTDDSLKILRKLQSEHKDIRLFAQGNQGTNRAINKGVSEASGEIIALLNSDDIFLEGKIARCAEIMERDPSIEIVSGGIDIIDSMGQVQRSGITIDWQKRSLDFFQRSKYLPLAILNENFIATTSNMVFTKKLWKTLGGFQDLRYCNDLDFLMSSFKHANYYFDGDHVHIHYRVHPKNTIKENLGKIRAEIAAVTAMAIVEHNTALIGGAEAQNWMFFQEFLKNKNLSDAVIFLIPLYLNAGNRRRFYELLGREDTQRALTSFLD